MCDVLRIDSHQTEERERGDHLGKDGGERCDQRRAPGQCQGAGTIGGDVPRRAVWFPSAWLFLSSSNRSLESRPNSGDSAAPTVEMSWVLFRVDRPSCD